MSETEPRRDVDEIDLTELGRKARGGWVWVVALAALGGAVGFGYTAVVKPVYEARAALLLPLSERNMGAAMGLGIGGSDPTMVVSGILDSERVRRPVMEEFRLKGEELADRLKVETLVANNQIRLRYRSEDRGEPEKALTLLIEGLRTVDTEVGLSLVDRRADVTSDALEKAKTRLLAAENDLKAFQEKSRTSPDPESRYASSRLSARLTELESEFVSVDRQYQTLKKESESALAMADDLPRGIESIDTLQAELREAQVRLAATEATFQPNTPQVRAARDQVRAVESALAKEVRAHYRSTASSINPKLIDLQTQRSALRGQIEQAQALARLAPQEAVQLQRLLRDVLLAEESVKKLQLNSEQLELESAATEVRWTLLDAPRMMEEPVNKRFGLNTALGVILGLLFGTLLALRRPTA